MNIFSSVIWMQSLVRFHIHASTVFASRIFVGKYKILLQHIRGSLNKIGVSWCWRGFGEVVSLHQDIGTSFSFYVELKWKATNVKQHNYVYTKRYRLAVNLKGKAWSDWQLRYQITATKKIMLKKELMRNKYLIED